MFTGCYKSLLALIEQFPNKQNSKIVFVGDLVDRGKNSFDVVKFVMENKYDCVKGNHEEMLLEYGPTKEELYFNDESKHWLYSCGGDETLTSYNNKKEEYYKHYDFLNSLPLYIEYQDYKTKDNQIFSNKSLNYIRCLGTEKIALILLIKIFLNLIFYGVEKSSKDCKEIFNVYGHTIFEEPKINQFSCGIDLGCCYKKNPSKIPNPRLCALEFPIMKLFIQENIED